MTTGSPDAAIPEGFLPLFRTSPFLDTLGPFFYQPLECPDLRIVGGHIGFPWTAEMISLATKYPNVYIDTSAYKARRYPTELVDYLRHHGRRKMLFGSNYPAWPTKDCLEGFDGLGLDEAIARLFLHDNAVRVFKLEDV
jgi:uncharacterized protein